MSADILCYTFSVLGEPISGKTCQQISVSMRISHTETEVQQIPRKKSVVFTKHTPQSGQYLTLYERKDCLLRKW